MERLDGFTNEGFGNVISGQIQDGDVVRENGVEFRYYTPVSTPPPVHSWDAFDFKKRFTQSERKAIRAASKSNPDVEDFVDMLNTAAMTGTAIKADDVLLNAALDAMTPNLLAEGRKAEILGAS